MAEVACSSCGEKHVSEAGCDPRIGTVLEAKYELQRVLGAGGMGKVYGARHTTIGRRLAVKFLLPQYATHKDVLRRFENEARTAGSLEHENIAAVVEDRPSRGPDRHRLEDRVDVREARQHVVRA